MGRADNQTLHNVQAFSRFAQIELGTARQHIHLVRVPVVEQFDHANLFGMARGLHGFAKQVDHLKRLGNLQVRIAEKL